MTPPPSDTTAEPQRPTAQHAGEDGAAPDADAPTTARHGRRTRTRPKRHTKRTFWDRLEAFFSRLSTRNNFWHRVCSLVWLPYAFKSGIKMAQADPGQYSYVLPFRRFNKNWYNAMAGAALLGNSEVAAGMYIFKHVGKDYTVVCKELHYKFLRPCFGPAVYRVLPDDTIPEKVKIGGEFNVPLTINIYQPPAKPSEREKRVGRCKATFHVAPKSHHKERKAAGRKLQVK
jgi:hypothetical protein